ncbi:antitoxin [Streptomyces sp. TRM 70351]|uniref:antitoxin n=1 Tax=Streptomyces sp. TRM 70351 TaxID=3116552 RepID=UPI002E7AE0A4|nr:antitoxin [Streptomyces sp. TRM 70351]MEE1927492.1 antitoxin [Streptomyces sp. TRM 70351]
MSMKDKLKGMLKGHEGQARQGVEKGGDQIDRRTGGKHSEHVDTAQRKLNDQLGTQPPEHGGDQPPRS